MNIGKLETGHTAVRISLLPLNEVGSSSMRSMPKECEMDVIIDELSLVQAVDTRF